MAKKTDISILAEFVSRYLILNNIEFNHLKLQKLLYYIQAWHLVYFDKELIFDEVPQAWVNGPVYRSVYDKFKHLGTFPMVTLSPSFKGQEAELFKLSKDKLILEDKQFQFLSDIIMHYGVMSDSRLVFLTHSELPWNEARAGLGPFDYSERLISIDTMYNYYKSLIGKN